MKEKREWIINTDALRGAVKFANAPGGGDTSTFLRFKFGVNQLSVSGFSGETWQIQAIQVASSSTEEFCVDPRVITPIWTIESPQITLTMIEDHCRIKWLTGEIKFATAKSESFPLPPTVTEEEGISVDVEELQKSIERVRPALIKLKSFGGSHLNAPFECVSLNDSGESLTVFATDKTRMHTDTIYTPEESSAGSVLIPPKMMAAIMSVKHKGRIVIRWNSFVIHAETIDRHEIVSAKVAGSHPVDWQKLLDQPVAFSFHFDRASLEATMSRFTDTLDDTCKVTIEPTPGKQVKMMSNSVNPPRNMQETIPCSASGELEVITVNANQMLSSLKSCKPSEVVEVNILRNEKGKMSVLVKPGDPGCEVKFKALIATVVR